MRVMVCVVVSLLFAATASAASTGIPKILERGFAQYQEKGPKAAIEAWTKGSAIEGSKEALSQANGFRKIEDFYGKIIGYELIKKHSISDSSMVFMVIVKYEKGPLFTTFHCYKLQSGDIIITSFQFHTQPDAVWPKSIIYGMGG